MEFHELIAKDKIFLMQKPYAAKLELLQDLLDCCLKGTELAEQRDRIWQTLLEREESMSTGIGQGVAIPHCSTDHVDTTLACFALLRTGVDFQSVDDSPVRLVVLLILPKNKFDKHVKTLAAVARLFNDVGFREAILEMDSPEEVHKLILSHQGGDALRDAG